MEVKKMNKKILIVDDEADILEVLKRRLEANGYDVVPVANGEEALDKLKTVKPDAVMLDILMPGIDGLEVLRMIREKDKKIPVFIITAFSNEERLNLANKLDASGFIVKTNDLQTEIQNITATLAIAEKHKA
jgi:CheY-like chemotaxis protein